nr:unnamed protein product [Spirometra erinaceieuropaei]
MCDSFHKVGFQKSSVMHKCESVSSQIIVKQQLEAHYKRLQSVKPRVDDSLPYSFYNNPKFRARLNPKRTSLRSLRPSNADNRNLPTPVRPYASDSFVDGIIQRMLTDDGFISEQSPQWLKITSSRHRSADRHGRSNALRSRTESNRSCSSARCRVVREQPADVFERRPQKFTPAKAFTPRTLRSSATSFIRNLECYNPPIKRRSTRSSPRASPVHEQENILRRSSYTNEQICVIFRRHLADRSSVLPTTLKRRALHQIVQQLNLPPAVAMVIGESSGMGDRISSEVSDCLK